MPLMSTISIHRSEFQSFFVNGCPNRNKCPRIAASWTMTMDSKFFTRMKDKKEDLSMQLSIPLIHKVETLRSSDLRFDRLQPSDHELVGDNIFEFGQFVAREAMLDEEYWTAAWLRAESHWENPTYERHGHNIRQVYQVKKEQKNVKRPLLKSVIGTLDLNIRYLLQEETFPGERVKAPRFCRINRTPPSRYGYIENLCVAKSARLQGIASNMLYFAIESAKYNGVEQVYVHVDRNNKPALILYHKIGFEVIEMENSQLLQEQLYLLRLEA